MGPTTPHLPTATAGRSSCDTTPNGMHHEVQYEAGQALEPSNCSAFETVAPSGSTGGCISAEELKMMSLYNQAKEALRRVQEVQTKVKNYLQMLERSSLSPYERPRIHALIQEAGVVCSISLDTRRHTKHDLARLIRTCHRHSETLFQLYVEAKSVITEGTHTQQQQLKRRPPCVS